MADASLPTAARTGPPALRLTARWLPIAALWLGFLAFSYVVYMDGAPQRYDFKSYYEGVQRLLDDAEPLYIGIDGHAYMYPPLMAQILAPLVATFSYETVSVVWFAASALSLLAATWLLARCVSPERAWIVWLLPVLFTPVFKSLYIGQVTVILLCLLPAAWSAHRAERRALAGGLLALAAWIKVFPAFLLVYFLLRRDWRVVRGALAAGLGLLAVQVIISGPGTMIDFFETLLRLTREGQPAGNFKNSAINGFVSRLFETNDLVIPVLVNDTLYTLSRWGLTLSMLAATAWAASRPRPASAETARLDLEYALVLIVSLLFGATLWVSGMPPLLLAFALVLFHAGTRARWLVGAAFVPLSFYHPFLVANAGVTFSAPVLSMGFAGIALLWGVALMQIIMRSGQRA